MLTSENLSQRLLSQFLIDFCKDTEDWLKEDKGMETVIFCPVYYLILFWTQLQEIKDIGTSLSLQLCYKVSKLGNAFFFFFFPET